MVKVIHKLNLMVFFVLISSAAIAQSIKVISYPDLKPLSNTNVAMDKKDIGITNEHGVFEVHGMGKEITISYLGYIIQIFPKPKRDSTIIMLPASILLQEVVINPPKEKILGYFGKWGNGVIYGKPDFNSSVVNSITIDTPSTLKSFLFYIPDFPNSPTNIPFEFVIFKEIDGQYQTIPLFSPIRIEQYGLLWNSFSLTASHLLLEPGNYLFGMKWIRSEIHHNKKNSTIRQALGTINKGATKMNSYRSTPREGWQLLSSQKDGVNVFNIALLGLITDM